MLHGPYSSGFTAIYKYLLPPVWIGIFGWVTYQLFVQPESVTFNGVRGGAPNGIEWLFLGAWLCGATFFLLVAWRLAWLRVSDGVLYLNYGGAEREVPPSWIRSVKELRYLQPRVIKIEFTDEEGRERSVWFMPAFGWPSGDPAEPRLLEELQALVDSARKPAA